MANNKVTQEVEFKAKADGAITTIKELKKAIQEATKGLEGNVKLSIDSKNFDKGIAQAQKKLDGLSKNIKITVDNKSALSSILEVKKALDGIKAKTLNIGIGNASKAADRVSKISNAINKINKDTVVDVKSSGLVDVENRVKNVAKQLDSIDKNLGIKISLDDGGTLGTLTRIRDTLIDIKKNSNINIKTSASSFKTRQTSGGSTRERSYSRRKNKEGKEHQVGDLLREQERQTQDNNFGVASANVIYSVGRASKGFGSALEVAAYQMNELSKKGGVLGSVATGVTSSLAVLTSLGATFTSLIGITTTLGNALGQLASFIFQTLRPGIEMYTSKTKATYGMAAAIKSQGYVNGKEFADAYGKNATNTSLALSTKLLNRAMLDAEKSVFDFSEIIESLQGTLPMLMSRGMSLDQAYEVNKGVASAAKTLQLAPNQVLQEVRDIAQNSITSRSSQVANALHITNEDLKQFGDDVEARFDYLMKKFASYQEMLEQYALTPVGAFERMKDRLLQVSSSIVEDIAPMFMGLFNSITNMTGQWVDEQGNILDTATNRWKQEGQDFGIDVNGNQISGGLDKEAGEATLQWAEALTKAKNVLIDLIEKTAQYTDGLLFFIEKLTDSEDPIEAVGKLLEGLISTFFSLVELTLAFGDACIGIFNAAFQPTMTFIRILQLMWKTFKALISSANVFGYTVSKALIEAVDKLPDGVKRFFGIEGTSSSNYAMLDAKLSEARKQQESDLKDLKDSANNMFNADNYKVSKALSIQFGQMNKVDGFLTKSFKYGEQIYRNAQQQQQQGVQSTDLGNIGGNPNPEIDANAKKKLIDEEQRLMKEKIDLLKDALKDHVDKIKDTLEKNKIAFDEGFMSLKDYFTQKAELEAEEAQARLAEAQEELAIIQNTQFANDYEKTKATHDVEREIREYTRKVGDATQAIKEVSENWNNAMASLGDFTDAMYANRSITSSPNSPFVNTAGMSNEEIAYRFLVSQGFEDAIARGIVAAMKGESLGNPQDEHIDSNGLLSMGIAQWNGQRRDKLLAFGQANNSDPYNIMTQLAFLVQELNTTEKEALNQAIRYYNENGKTAEAMTYGFTKYVERPEDIDGEATRRMDFVDVVDAVLKSSNAQQQASVSMNNVSEQIGGATKSLIDNNGNLLGYTPESQYSYGGFDTRFIDFDDFNESLESLGKVQENVKMAFNLIAKRYWEKTGERLEPTSFTGSNLHQDGEFSHYAGWKADVAYYTKDILVEIAKELGVAVGWEGNHYDMSFGKGGVGGQQKTPFGTGEEFYNRMSAGRWSNTVPGGSYQSRANRAATGTESNKKFEEMVAEALQRGVDAQAQILDVFNPNYKAGIMARTNQIVEKYRKEARKVTMQIPEGKERDQQLQNLIVSMNGELNDLETQILEKRLEYNVNATKTWGKYAGYETFKGNAGSMTPEEFIKKYEGYYYDDVSNPLAPAYAIDKLWAKVKDYESIGSVDKASATRQKILDTYNNLTTLFDEYLNNISNYMNNYRKWADSAGMTKLQRERAGLEIDSAENRIKSEVLGEQITRNDGVLQKYSDEITRVNEELAKYIALERGANSVGDTDKAESYRKKVAYYKSEEDRLKLSRQQLAIRTDQLKQEKLIADNMSNNDNLLKQTRETAKQALEEGLVKFLTDGVNQAKSLGDALRDLFTGILKEMQQFFAKQLVTSIMNGINPMMRPEYGTDNYGRYNDQFSMTTNYPGIGQRGVYQGNNQLMNTLSPTPTIMQKPWEKEGAFNVDLLGKKDYKSSALNSLTEFGSKVDIATASLTDFGLGTNTAKEAVDSLASTTQEGATQSAVTQITTLATEAGTAIQTAGTTLATAINTVAAQVQSSSIGSMGKGFSVGGLISGIGTETSDSIPTMLSNGEYVVKASSVKKMGINFLDAINSGNFSKIRARLPKFANGGVVGDIQGDTARGMEAFANSIGTNVSTVNNMNIALVRDEDEAMRHFMRSPDGQRIMLDFSRKNAHLTSQF